MLLTTLDGLVSLSYHLVLPLDLGFEFFDLLVPINQHDLLLIDYITQALQRLQLGVLELGGEVHILDSLLNEELLSMLQYLLLGG